MYAKKEQSSIILIKKNGTYRLQSKSYFMVIFLNIDNKESEY